MAEIRVNGARIHYDDSGSGPETIVFAHGLLWSGRMFDDQVEALKDRYRTIAFDFRGQGQSEVTAGGYDMDTLAEDAAALIEALDAAPCHFAGLSMGGFVGLRLAARKPHLLRSLVLLETAAGPEPPENVPRYRLLNFIARWLSLGLVAGQIMPIMFGEKFLRDPARSELRRGMRRRLLSNHKIGATRAVKGVIARQAVADELGKIDLPTLIMVGDQDKATPLEKAQEIQAGIRGSKLVVIPGAGHTSSVEEPEAVNAALDEFLNSLER